MLMVSPGRALDGKELKELSAWADERDACLYAASELADGAYRPIVAPALMSKGVALAAMQCTLGLSPERTLVAGDGLNDLPMFDLALARYQVCPANASERVKAKVAENGGILCAEPYSDGIVKALGRCT